MIGETLGHYRILRELGAGGMGKVYLAEDLRLKRRIALKTLLPEVAGDADRLRRLRSEAESAAALNHPNIVTIHSVEEEDGVLFLTMELIEGSTLERHLRKGGLELPRVFNFALPIAEALAAAHAKGIAHRDLTPRNVMVGADGRIKVLDFGLARACETAGDLDVSQLPTGILPGGESHIAGTLPYMSPEQLEGGGVDHRSDIFSFGVLLYELATGRRPFAGRTSPALMSAILRDRPPAVTEIKGALPRGLGRIIHICLEKDPRCRYQSVLDVRNELSALRDEVHSAAAGVAPLAAARAAPAGEPAGKSVAVLPFANMSADPDNEYFSDGISEEIINALTQLPGLRVAARTSAFAFKEQHVDISRVGRRLNVATVLEGSVRRAGNRVRITATLVDAARGHHLWSERYDRQADDIFAIQDEIAAAIAEKLKVSLSAGETGASPRPATHDLEAYDHYLRGRFYLEQRGKGLGKGLELLQKAVQIDPDYALPYAGLADGFSLASFYGFLRPAEAIPRAKAAAERALELDASLAEAHTSLAFAAFSYDWDWAAAERRYRRAIELKPSYVAAHYWYGFYLLCARRRFDEAVAESRLAVELDPLATYPGVMLGVSLFGARRYDEMVEILRPTVERDPTSFIARRTLGMGQLLRGDCEGAISTLRTAVELSARHPWPLSDLGLAYAAAGRSAEASDIQDELVARSRAGHVQPVLLTQIPLTLGNRSEALDHLERAFDERDGLIVVLAVWPTLDPLRGEARFQRLVDRLALPG